MKENQFLKSAAVLSLGGLTAKGIGAIYRVTLSNFLGGYGMGLYQMAYPLFCVLLTFSSAGIPSAFSRLIARETARGSDGYFTLKTALRLFALLGLCGTGAMCLIAPSMSRLQGEGGLLRCYLMLAPSVFFVALIAVLRGYFQGKHDMRPTAISEIVEQVIKTGLGLLLALRFQRDPVLSVSYCLLAVSVSEAAALFYLFLQVRGEPRRNRMIVKRESGTDILYAALPVMAATGLLPLSQTVDSVFLVRLLQGSGKAVKLYGLFAGSALSLINLPSSVCYGLAASSVPSVAKSFAEGKQEEGRYQSIKALLLTFLLSVPCALGFFFVAKQIVGILYPALNAEDAQILISLLKLMSVSAVTLSATDTLAACLTGMGRAKFAALSMLTAVLVKFALQWALVGRLSVIGAAISANACYLVAFFLDLIYTVKKSGGRVYGHSRKSRDGAGRIDAEGGGSGAFSRRSSRSKARDPVRADASRAENPL